MTAIIRLIIHLTFYPTLWFSWVMHRLGLWQRWNALDEHVLLGSLPTKRDMARLKSTGVGATVNMCEEFRGHVEELRRLRVDQLHLPTLDYFCPTEDDIVRGLHFIDAQIAAGRKVYLHCKAGRGRSATVALCYLMRRQGLSVEEAYARLRAARPQVSRNLRRRQPIQNVERMLRDGSFPEPDESSAAVVGSNCPDARRPAGPGWTARVVAWAALGVVTLTFHGCSVTDGLWLDDHWHQRQLRDLGWSFSELLDTTRLEPDRIIHAWWQDRSIAFQYARPFAVLLQKTVYRLSGGSVIAQHVVSLALHVAAAALVFELCWLLTRRVGWSLVAGLVHAIYPLSVFAVGWLAAQNAVLQTVLTLAALLLYIRASGLMLHRSELPDDKRPVPRLRLNSFAAAMCCWMLALFSRENAIVFPVLMLGVDLAFGGRRILRGRWKAYTVAAAIALAFVYWRISAFEFRMPDVYYRRPDGFAWLAWCVVKLMHYLTCAVWPAPMSVGPTGRDNPFAETPIDVALMAGILAVMGGSYIWLTRHTRGWWLWPMWLVLAVLPVVPILATPHSGYLCGVGFAIGVGMAAGAGPRRIAHKPSRWRRAIPAVVLGVSAAYLPVNWLAWRGMLLAERFTLAGLTLDDPPPPGTQLFFINLPFVNTYVGPCLAETWGPVADQSRCHALLYSPDLVRADQPCVVRQLDRHSIEVSIEGEPYFSGLLGQFLIDGMRGAGPLRRGDRIQSDDFVVRILDADEDGVSRLTFTFPRPLDDDGYRFYFTTFESGATRLRFRPDGGTVHPVAFAASEMTLRDVRSATDRMNESDAAGSLPLFAAVHASDADVRAAAIDVLLPVVRAVTKATGSPLYPRIAKDEPDAATWTLLDEWWTTSVTDLTLRQAWGNRDVFADLAYRRDELRRLPGKLTPFVELDLYVAGPPRRGPK